MAFNESVRDNANWISQKVVGSVTGTQTAGRNWTLTGLGHGWPTAPDMRTGLRAMSGPAFTMTPLLQGDLGAHEHD